ncbi:hypothetical protein BC826DRAFT_1177113 [Russula brevipes]|nr:hypothetical protein BC826DRAFT_1177113 [Russula brevipes]
MAPVSHKYALGRRQFHSNQFQTVQKPAATKVCLVIRIDIVPSSSPPTAGRIRYSQSPLVVASSTPPTETSQPHASRLATHPPLSSPDLCLRQFTGTAPSYSPPVNALFDTSTTLALVRVLPQAPIVPASAIPAQGIQTLHGLLTLNLEALPSSWTALLTKAQVEEENEETQAWEATTGTPSPPCTTFEDGLVNIYDP